MATKAITIILESKDAANLRVVLQDPRIERGTSEALRLCVEDAYHLKPDFKRDLEKAKSFDNKDLKIAQSDLGSKSFLVEEEVFQEVYDWVKRNMGLMRPRISFVVKACLVSARVRIEERKCQYPASTEEKTQENMPNIPSMGEAMLMLGQLYQSKSDLAKEKIEKIISILMEG